MEYARDSAMTALILGFFASCWFGWAQERPPSSWRTPLILGAMLSLAVAAFGAVAAWRHWSGGSALGEPGAMRQYGIVVGVEFGITAAGAVALALWRRRAHLAPWVCLVVGLHFWPLAPVLQNPALLVLGALLVANAVAAVLLGSRISVAESAITGAGAGAVLLVFAAWGAVAAIM